MLLSPLKKKEASQWEGGMCLWLVDMSKDVPRAKGRFLLSTL